MFKNLFRRLVEIKVDGRDVGLDAIHPDVALALLFRVVKRMGVKKRPDELAANILEAKFESGMLENGVMAAIECSGSDIEALLVGNFFGGNEMVGVAGACGGDRGIEGMIEIVTKRYARRS